jgi:hypothetical protein
MLDQRGIMYSLLKDFPSLYTGVVAGTDPSWTSVKLLIGADGSIVDESLSLQSITNTATTVGTQILGNSTGSMLFDANTDKISVADTASLRVGSQSMTVEEWYTGPGSSPAYEYVFFAKAQHTTPIREWLLNEFSGGITMFVSADGANWTNATVYTFGTNERQVFFNGAPRHIALVKNGSTWSVYLNGEQMTATLSIGTVPGGAVPVTIGYSILDLTPLGRVDDFRLSMVSRYTTAMHTLRTLKFPRS